MPSSRRDVTHKQEMAAPHRAPPPPLTAPAAQSTLSLLPLSLLPPPPPPPAMMAAFIARPFPIAERSYCRRSVPRSSRRPRRPRRPRPPRCVATKLLVVDLQELLRHAPPHELNQFSERVQVERNSSESGTYLLYSSRSGYAPSVKSIHDARLVEPDALAVLDGTELYQRSYRTPDPLWASNVRKDWAPKPIQWIVATFFGDHLELVETTEEYQLLFRCKPGVALSDLCSQLTGKLREMGIASRVNLYDGDRHITVTPAVSGASELVAFCQTMLGIEQKNTFVFGNDHLVETCVRGKANFGMCPAESDSRWDGFGDRVFVSKKKGARALLDGVLHHAVF